MTITASKIKIKDSTTYRNLLDIFYPVGSVYISTVKTNPASFLGGTWVAISSENAVLRASTTFGLTGSDTHKLTDSEMPSHHHGAGTYSASTAGTHLHNLNTWLNSGGISYLALYRVNSVGSSSGNWYDVYDSLQGNTISPSGSSHSVQAQNNGAHTHAVVGSSGNSGGGLHTQLFNVLSIALCGDELLKCGDA